MAAKSRGEKLRRQRRHHAVSPSDAGADGDEREHVEVAGNERMPAPHEKRPAGPENDRSRQRQLEDVIDIWGQPNAEVDQMAAHFQHGHRQRQYEPDPEPPRHVEQFGIGRRFGRDGDGFERHAADRTGARADLPDFGMHRAGVDRAFHRHGFRRDAGLEIFLRRGGKFAAAARRAEIIGLIAIVVAMPTCRRIDGHAANRIDCHRCGRSRMEGLVQDVAS